MKLMLAIFPVLAFAAGGAQQYAESIKAHTIKHGAPPHPLHIDRDAVRSGDIGHAGPFNVSTTAPTQAFTHFFETSVGSGHMSLTAREDWRTHMRMAARDLGVKRIRGHGLLDDDMSVSYAYGKHAFYNIDSLVDLLLSIGMRPIFELSFMPDWLASGPDQVCHYKGNTDPPKNYTEWGELIGALGSHMVSKYGEDTASEFVFEVWNEPNDQFWRGGETYGPPGFTKQTSYFELYKHAALALKAASPKLQVGGPATCCAACWLQDFVKFMDNNSIPYDFISTHAYSSCSMEGLGDVGRVVRMIGTAMSDLKNATSGDHPNHPAGKTPPWLITEFGDSCSQGIGDSSHSQFFPSAIHDMIDQSSYITATIDRLAGSPGEPQALSYWAISDVFEESFFPVHNESFHGMFGLINLHGVPKPSYRAYQLLHETGTARLQVQGPKLPTPPVPSGSCSAPVDNTDVWGGDVAPPASPCPTCGLFTMADCCDLCLRQNEAGVVCDTAVLWHTSGQEGLGNRCGLKRFDKKTNLTKNTGRSYVRVTRTPSPAPSNDVLCGTNTGVMAVRNGTDVIDILVYNHASFANLIVDCTITVNVVANLASATVRRIDETHANPLATWIDMGAPDYTTAAQNAALLASSQLVVEKLSDIADVGENSFTIKVPTHGVAAVRILV
jgi:xylan 1,4-beta-xylosidase